MTRAHDSIHLDDGDLVRLLGDELDGDERARVEAHLEGCAACAERLEEERARLEAVRGLIGSIEVPALDPARREQSLEAVRAAARRRRTAASHSFGPLARAAAVASLLFATAVVASPARGWITGMWKGLTGNDTVEQPAVAPNAMSARSSVVAFAARSDELTVSLQPQTRGTLTVRVEDTPTVSARLSGGDGEIDVTVLPASIRIDNGIDDRAEYEVTVPATLERLTIQVGDGRSVEIRPSERGAGYATEIDLAQAAPTTDSDSPDGRM